MALCSPLHTTPASYCHTSAELPWLKTPGASLLPVTAVVLWLLSDSTSPALFWCVSNLVNDQLMNKMKMLVPLSMLWFDLDC